MIGTRKPTASLSSGLLARKGSARPAMRTQGYVAQTPAAAHDDLGWDDMGDDAPAPKPVVLRQIEALGEQISPAGAQGAADNTKAAFTLRLDPDRHLRLRLAAAVTQRSAQQIMCQALDAYLESLTEVEALARQIGPDEDL
jgi:hypothetical protein